MKALIISEDENLVSSCSNFLKQNDYDIIIYKWLLKALDNIEEIRPDLIVVSSSEYPRHWKTLVQFVKSGIGGDNIDIYLYEPTPLSGDDLEKAKVLGITNYFTCIEDLEEIFNPQEVPSVDNIISENENADVSLDGDFVNTANEEIDISNNTESEITSEPELTETEPEPEFDTSDVTEDSEETDSSDISEDSEEIDSSDISEDSEEIDSSDISEDSEESEPVETIVGHILLNNPVNNKFISGKVIQNENDNLVCLLDFETDLQEGIIISKATYIWNGELKSFNANLQSVSEDKKEINLLVNEYYEEI